MSGGEARLHPRPPVAGVTIRDAEPRDVPVVLALVRELAEYERLAHLVSATEEDYHAALFGPGAHAQAAVAEIGAEVVGYMVWFRSFSTFKARSKLYLEDLYVAPEYRGRGFGTAMLAHLAALCHAEGLARMQWQVLDWNAPSIAFYRSLGADVSSHWWDCSLAGDALAALAARATHDASRVTPPGDGT